MRFTDTTRSTGLGTEAPTCFIYKVRLDLKRVTVSGGRKEGRDKGSVNNFLTFTFIID